MPQSGWDGSPLPSGLGSAGQDLPEVFSGPARGWAGARCACRAWGQSRIFQESWWGVYPCARERKAGPSSCSSSRDVGTHSLPLLPQMDGPPAHVMKTQPCILKGLIRHISGSGGLGEEDFSQDEMQRSPILHEKSGLRDRMCF